MLCFTHQGEPYGHLRRNGKNIPPHELARMVGAPGGVVTRLLRELEDHHVFSRTPEGTIYSRRQVRDEALREKRGSFGALSQAHPDVPKRKAKDGRKDTLQAPIGGSPPSPSPSPSPSPTPVSQPVHAREDGPPTPATPQQQASQVALAVLGPPDRKRPTHCEHGTERGTLCLPCAHTVAVVPKDEPDVALLRARVGSLLADVVEADPQRQDGQQWLKWASRTKGGAVIRDYRSCDRAAWLRTTAERLETILEDMRTAAAGGMQLPNTRAAPRDRHVDAVVRSSALFLGEGHE
jgi:hypothetical protein